MWVLCTVLLKVSAKATWDRQPKQIFRMRPPEPPKETHILCSCQSSVWICLLGVDTQVVNFLKHDVVSSIHYLSIQKIQEGIRKPVFTAHLLSKIINFKSIPLTHPDKNYETVFQVKILTLFHSLEKDSWSSEQDWLDSHWAKWRPELFSLLSDL